MRRRPTIARPKQDLPGDLVDSLLASIGELYYPARKTTPAERKRWAIDQHWYRQRVILWAAAWLNNRAVTLLTVRFKQILLDKLTEIRRFAPAEVQNWPRYITKCIQDHFAHNGETIYEEGKTLRAQLETTLGKLPPAGASAPDPIRVLALAHQLTKPKPKKLAKNDSQPDLFL